MRLIFLLVVLNLVIGCKKDPGDPAAGSTTPTASSAPKVAAKPTGLGIKKDQFLTAWNACAAALGDNAVKLKIESLPESDAWIATFTRGVTLSGAFVGPVLQHLVLSKGGSDLSAALLGRFAFSCMAQVASPKTDEKGLISDLGMTTGTSTTAVRGAVTFAFSQETGGPELISVYATGSTKPSPLTPPPVEKPCAKWATVYGGQPASLTGIKMYTVKDGCEKQRAEFLSNFPQMTATPCKCFE